MERREEETGDGKRRIQSKEDVSIGKFLEMIPLDLIPNILLNLPAKSAARFRCVSKLWSSITTRPYFIRSFAIQSSTRLCLLVSLKAGSKRYFISLPQKEHPETSYSHVERYQIIAPKSDYEPCSESVHGLMCVGDFTGEVVVWNPTMRQHVTLPDPGVIFKSYFLGYDPVEDKYKVLCSPSRAYRHLLAPLVFTLGPRESWRVIKNSPRHFPPKWPVGHIGICINGHVYYQADIRFKVDHTFEYEEILVSFDVRHEKFNIIRKPADPTLCDYLMFNYQGKLAWVCSGSQSSSSSLRFWVLEDEEKQEWSPKNFLMPFPFYRRCDPIWENVYLLLKGVTHDTGEFIFVDLRFQTIYVSYYDPKRDRTRVVEYEGIADKKFLEDDDLETLYQRIQYCYPNHSESLMSLENVPRYDYS